MFQKNMLAFDDIKLKPVKINKFSLTPAMS